LIHQGIGRREELVEELGEASRGLAAAAILVAFAALVLAILPVAVLLSGANLDSLSPALTSLAGILTGTKLVAAVWGAVSSLE
jgi:hypothetical protein